MNANVMDKEPFVKWDLLTDDPPPTDFLTVLQRAEYNPGLLATYAKRTREKNLLIGELGRLLEPSNEFTKLAIVNIETRNLTAAVIESWKPVVANAISEWARQRALSSVIDSQSTAAVPPQTDETGSKIETTQEELDCFAMIQRLLGADRPVAYEDTASYFKIHLTERRTWVMCRVYAGRKRPAVWVPLPSDRVSSMAAPLQVTSPQVGWSCIMLDSTRDVERLGDVLRAAWDSVKTSRSKAGDDGEG